MRETVKQGDIIAFADHPIKGLVLSKDIFNRTGMSILCPVANSAPEDPLHISVGIGKETYIALCEHLKSFDLKKRHYKTLGSIDYAQIQEVTDAVQGIFDYYPF